MSFTEKLLHCYSCKKHFVFAVEAQELRSSQGYPNDPINCPACRRARKTRTSDNVNQNSDFNLHQPMYPVTCSQCGKSVQVHFQPRPGRPIYCSDCRMKIRVSR
jgi:CxxC-x17-CxxC domain-containing protein